MKKRTYLPSFILLFLLIPLLTSCEINCDAFDRNNEMMSIRLFPQDRETYEFAPIDPSLSTLRFEKVSFEFSEQYTQNCEVFNEDCDCFSWHTTEYQSSSPNVTIVNDLSIIFWDTDPEDSVMKYIVYDDDNGLEAGRTIEFPVRNNEILRDINNLSEEEITINGITFTNVLVINLTGVNTTLIIERNRGLQGIVYRGELFTLIN